MKERKCQQKEVFKRSEGDRYYQRNKIKLEKMLKSWKNDPIIHTISGLDIHPQSILEIGCSDGWRLHALGDCYKSRCFGIDPSGEAIQEGINRFPELSLQRATADEIPYANEMFDLVIFGFCLYLCDRMDLFKIACEVDRVLMNQGKLIILDFLPPFPYRNAYVHCSGIFSYKMNYSNLFLWNPAYYLIYQRVFACLPEKKHIPDERISVIALNKDTKWAYPDNPY